MPPTRLIFNENDRACLSIDTDGKEKSRHNHSHHRFFIVTQEQHHYVYLLWNHSLMPMPSFYFISLHIFLLFSVHQTHFCTMYVFPFYFHRSHIFNRQAHDISDGYKCLHGVIHQITLLALDQLIYQISLSFANIFE